MNALNSPKKYIGKYELIEEIGRGGMGIVYKGVDPYMGRPLAIKTIRLDSIIADKDFDKWKQRIIEEAKLTGNLKHQNIITIYDAGEDSGNFFIAMEYIEGQSLRGLIDSGKSFSLEEIKNLMSQICDALSYAHKRDVIHCDIKPENIILDASNKAIILDFGIARMCTATLVQTQNFKGSPGYMSPEQIKGENPDTRSDIFSLGAVLYEIITGHMAFSGDNIASVIQKIINDDPPKPSSADSELARTFNNIVKKALAKKPKKRYQNCEELLNDIINISIKNEVKSFRNIISRNLIEYVYYFKPRIKALKIPRPVLFSVITITGLIVLLSFYFTGRQVDQSRASYQLRQNSVSEKSTYRDPKQSLNNEKKSLNPVATDNKSSAKSGTRNQNNRHAEQTKETFVLHFKKGEKYFNEGIFEKAVNEFETALTIDPDNKEAKRYSELTKTRIQEMGELNALFTGHFNKGLTYYEKGNFDGAVIELKAAISIAPNHEETKKYLELANIEMKKSRQLEGEEDKNKKIQEYYSNGIGAFREGNFAQAILYFKEVIKLDPDHKDAKKYMEMAKIKKFDTRIDSDGSSGNRKKEDAKLPEGF